VVLGNYPTISQDETKSYTPTGIRPNFNQDESIEQYSEKKRAGSFVNKNFSYFKQDDSKEELRTIS
jgi:hypothetical protein